MKNNINKRALYESIMKNVSVEVKKYLNEKFDDGDVKDLQLKKKNLNTKVYAIKFNDMDEVKQYIHKNCSKSSYINTIFKDVHAYFQYDNDELNNLFNFNATIDQMEKLYSLSEYEDNFSDLSGTISEMLLILAVGLVQNGLPKSAYTKALLYGWGFNPFDYSWFEDDTADELLNFIDEYPEYFDLAYTIAENTGDAVNIYNIFAYASELDEIWG